MNKQITMNKYTLSAYQSRENKTTQKLINQYQYNCTWMRKIMLPNFINDSINDSFDFTILYTPIPRALLTLTNNGHTIKEYLNYY